MNWDCIIVGGGAAGLSAGLVLGRARRRTLIIDKGEPSNRFAHGIGGLLGQDGRPPADFYAAGREELAKYPSVEYRRGEVVDGEVADGEVARGGVADGDVPGGESPVCEAALGEAANGEPRFTLTLADGTRETADRVLLATGMNYRYPDVPGVAERWGRAAFHCPFCHGWEVRGRPLYVLDASEHGPRRAALLRAWSDNVTLLTDPAEVAELRDDEIVFADGSTKPCGGLLLGVTLHQRDGLAEKLGAEALAPGMIAADALEVDQQLATTAPGVYAAGDVLPQAPSVAAAIASGSTAAAMIVHDLMLG